MSRRSARYEAGPGRPGRELSATVLLLLHGACYLLVLFYVNMFTFWAWLSRALGPGILARVLPVAVTVLVLLVIAQRFVDRVNRGYRVNLVFLGLGLVCAIFSLALPDPHVPIKRIHVAEYIVLSFLVRATLSGAVLGHGVLCCVRPAVGVARPRVRGPAVLVTLFVLVGASTAWLVFMLYQQRGSTISLLALLPQAASCLLLMVLRPEIVFSSRTQHGLQAVFWLALSLLAYPLAARFAGMEFI